MSKKIIFVITALALCLMLAACGQAVPHGTIEMDPTTGAGSASFMMVVPKNGAPDVGNNFIEPNGDDGPNNTAYIKNPEALKELIANNLPEGFTVEMEEVEKLVEREDEFGDPDTVDEGSFNYTVSFSFNSADDFNAKLKTWLPQTHWDAAAAVLTFEVKEAVLANSGLTVDMHILDVIGQWAFTLISTDTTGAVVDGGSGFDYAYVYNLAKSTMTLKVGDDEVTERYDTVAMDVVAGAAPAPSEPATEPSQTDAPTDPAPTEPSAQEPAGMGPVIIGVIAAVVVLAAVVVIVLVRKGKK